jgi:glutamyl-tRNA reductase
MRGCYALNAEQQADFYQRGLQQGLSALCILNTCNRTEIYGCGNVDTARNIYLNILRVKEEEPNDLMTLVGEDAVRHIFRVAAGLDSQVVGDLEILGQFKQAVQFAKTQKALNGYLERLSNVSIQSAKEIRTSTNLSSGTVSLSYAAVKYIKNHFGNEEKKVLIIGVGDFGKSIAQNVRKYLPKADLVLTNRTEQKAAQAAAQLHCRHYPFEALADAVREADVIISAVHSDGKQLIGLHHFQPGSRRKLLIDMSVPLSIDPQLGQMEKCRLVTVDEVSGEIERTIETRLEDIPLAHQIIDQHVQEFCEWADFLKNTESIRQWKSMMTGLSASCPHMQQFEPEERAVFVKKNLSAFTHYLRTHTHPDAPAKAVFQHFLTESDKALACQKACAHAAQRDCPACQIA